MIASIVFYPLICSACFTLMPYVAFSTLAFRGSWYRRFLMEQRRYRRGVFARYFLVLFYPDYHPNTNKGFLCLLGWMPRGKWPGWPFVCFREREKCCTIFDFENCAVMNLLEAVLISARHSLETGCLSSGTLLIWLGTLLRTRM